MFFESKTASSNRSEDYTIAPRIKVSRHGGGRIDWQSQNSPLRIVKALIEEHYVVREGDGGFVATVNV